MNLSILLLWDLEIACDFVLELKLLSAEWYCSYRMSYQPQKRCNIHCSLPGSLHILLCNSFIEIRPGSVGMWRAWNPRIHGMPRITLQILLNTSEKAISKIHNKTWRTFHPGSRYTPTFSFVSLFNSWTTTGCHFLTGFNV